MMVGNGYDDYIGWNIGPVVQLGSGGFS